MKKQAATRNWTSCAPSPTKKVHLLSNAQKMWRPMIATTLVTFHYNSEHQGTFLFPRPLNGSRFASPRGEVPLGGSGGIQPRDVEGAVPYTYTTGDQWSPLRKPHKITRYAKLPHIKKSGQRPLLFSICTTFKNNCKNSFNDKFNIKKYISSFYVLHIHIHPIIKRQITASVCLPKARQTGCDKQSLHLV